MVRSPAALSPLEQFRLLPADERERRLATLTDEQKAGLAWQWAGWKARPNQCEPEGDWRIWLLLAGRGFGKTRTGAEWVRDAVRESRYVNLVSPTADDARDVMVEGESGILAICPRWERPEYQPSKRKLQWPNGATSLIFTADEPERLRGKQHEKVWAALKIICSSCNQHIYDTDQPITASDLGQPLDLERFTPTKAEWKPERSPATALACPNCGAALLGSMPNIRQESV